MTLLPLIGHMMAASTTAASSQVTWIGAESSDENTKRVEFEDNQNDGKGLTVTFKDVAIEVHGLGEDYGPTVASVVTDLIPTSFGKDTKSRRVGYFILFSVLLNPLLMLIIFSTFCKVLLVKSVRVRW